MTRIFVHNLHMTNDLTPWNLY